MNKSILYFFLFVLAGCSKGERKSSHVFFAGEIVNPTSDYVVLRKGETIIDSARLDENNRFSIVIDSITNGLYHFKHAPEYQYVYLEEGDSLVVRLNTVDFDESLVFSGIGEEVNNFLLELFLANEDEVQLLLRTYYNMEPEAFYQKIDSLRNQKLEDLVVLDTDSKLSAEAKELVKASIDYTYFTYLEEYPFKHKKHSKKETLENLPENFYAYRKNVDFENKKFTYLGPYYNFMTNHFGNLTYTSCSQECAIKNDIVKNKLHYNRHMLKLIDSLVKEPELKDNLFRNVAFDYLLKGRDEEKNYALFMEDLHNLSGNNRHIDEIDMLYEGIKNIQPNKKIPNIFVYNSDGDTVSLQEIAKDKKMVFYFWSGTERKHFQDITQRVSRLSSVKPDYSFVGISLKVDEANWKGMINAAGLDESNQYRAKNIEELSKALIIYPRDKCIITDDATIVDAFSSIYRTF